MRSSGKGTAGNCKRMRICRAGALGSFTRSEVTQVSVTHCSLAATPSLWKSNLQRHAAVKIPAVILSSSLEPERLGKSGMHSAVVISCLSQMEKETLEAIVLYSCKEVSERASCVVILHDYHFVCFNFLFNIHKESSQSHLLVMGAKRREEAALSTSSRLQLPLTR